VWLVVGLGNPGPKYEWTRHNCGFILIDELARRTGRELRTPESQSLTARVRIGDEEALLVKPQTFMNLSGQCVREIAGFFRVPPIDVLVVTDDVSLPLGKLRVRAQGTHGGHNGLRNIQDVLQTTEYPRLRVGVEVVGHPPVKIGKM